MVPELDEVPSRPPWTAARTSSWPTSPGACSPSACSTPPYQYSHGGPHQPLGGPSAEEQRARAAGWQPEPGHSVPRRLPTPLSPACPPSAVPPLGSWAPDYDEADPYHGHRRYSQGSQGYGSHREPGNVGYPRGSYHVPGAVHSLASAGSYGPAEGQLSGPSNGDPRSVKRGSATSEGEPEERRKRRNFSADTTETLKKWVETRIDNPHFDPKEVAETAKKTGKTRSELSSPVSFPPHPRTRCSPAISVSS
jgi:hypothetical protein